MRKEERTWKRLIMAVLVAVAVCAVSALVAVADGECYADVRISGTGNAWVNGNIPFRSISNDRPAFQTYFLVSATELVVIDIVYSSNPSNPGWLVWVDFLEFTNPQDMYGSLVGMARYIYTNASDSSTPPRTGWTLGEYLEGGVHDSFVVNTPTLSGGQPCTPPSFVITGLGPDGAILDQTLALPEGEEPPMVGLCPLAAIYDVGDLVTGACSIDDEEGSTVRGTYIHVYIYSVDIEPRPDVVTLLDHWTVHYDRDRGGYSYGWDTRGYAPGYYDVHLSFGDGTSHTCRIQLIAQTE